MAVPSSVGEVTGAWLAIALAEDSRFRGARWPDIETTQIGQGFGLDGTLLQVRVPGSFTPSLIVKLADWSTTHNEPHFYRLIAPEMPGRLPVCYGSDDDESGRFVLLLEDLSAATQGDCLVGASEVQTDALVSIVAKYHARFWGATDPVVADRNRFVFDPQASIDDFDGHCERFIHRFSEEAGPDVDALLAELPRRAAAASELFATAVPTFVHTDLHLDNVLFLGDEPVILDWPGAALGPGAIDLGRVMIEGMTLEQRRRRQPKLVALYRDVLVSEGVATPSMPEMNEQLAAVCAWMCWWTIGWAGSEDPGLDRPRVMAILSSLARNTFGAARDDWLHSGPS
jgi:hypothetical protein